MSMNDMIGWHIYTDPERDQAVTRREHVLVAARDREEAKRLAKRLLKTNPDQYVCQPLTPENEIVTVMLSDGHFSTFIPATLGDRD